MKYSGASQTSWANRGGNDRGAGRLNPEWEKALKALSLGPLDRTPDGWIPRRGDPGCWNTHTITYMAKTLGLCTLNHGATVAGITERGRALVPGEDAA